MSQKHFIPSRQHIITGVIIAIAAIFFFVSVQDAQTPSEKQKTDIMQTKTTSKETSSHDGKGPIVTFTLEGILEDVTGGSAMGIGMAGYTDGLYVLDAVFEDLPETTGTDYYEGWLVREGTPTSVISTGKATKESENTYSHGFTSEKDLRDHTTFVLTLEPNDGNPAPAKHILKGILKTK